MALRVWSEKYVRKATPIDTERGRCVVEIIQEVPHRLAAVLSQIKPLDIEPPAHLLDRFWGSLADLPEFREPNHDLPVRIIGSVVYVGNKAQRYVYVGMLYNKESGLWIVPVRENGGNVLFSEDALPLFRLGPSRFARENNQKLTIRDVTNVAQIISFMQQNPDLAPWVQEFMLDILTDPASQRSSTQN